MATGGNTLMSLLVKLGVDSKALDEGLGNAEKKSKGVGGAIAKGFGGAVAVGIAGAATAIGAVTGAIASTIGPAVSLGESINAANVVFGEASEVIKEYGENASMSVGMSNQAFAQSAAITGAFLTNLGMNQAEAAKETINLTERAADMASIFNTDVATAMESIQSGLKGEFNPLEKFGVSLRMATIEAKALEMGLVKEGDELDNNAKMQASLALIYEQTDKYAGDFLNTQDGLANGMRQVSATFEDVKAAIGTAFLPYLQEGANLLKELGLGFKDILNPMREVTTSFWEMDENGKKVRTTLTEMVPVSLEEQMGEVGTLIGGVAGKLLEALPTITAAALGLVTGLAQGMITAIPTIMPMMVQLMLGLVNAIIELTPMMLDAAFQIILQLALGLADALPELIPSLVQMMLDIVMVIVKNVPLLIEAAIAIILGLVDGIIEALPIIIEELPAIVIAIVEAIMTSLPLLIDAALEVVLALIEGILSNLPLIITTIIDLVVTIASTIIENLPKILEAGKDTIKKLIDGIKEMWPDMKQAAIDTMEGFWEGLESKFEDIWKGIKDFGKEVTDTLKGILGIKSPSKVFFGIGKNMMLGLEEGINKFAVMPNFDVKGTVEGVKPNQYANGNTYEFNAPTANEIGKAVVQHMMQAGALG